MARYGGGHEDFEKERAELEALKKARQEQIAREATFQRRLAESTRLQDESARTSHVQRQAKRQAADADERAARSAGNAAKATRLDTQAIEANTRARQRAIQLKSMGERAVYGARSPQYSQAYQLMQEGGGQIPSQYRLRQIEGVGQRRAAAMVQAMQAGLRPQTGQVDINRPLSRVAAAHEAVAASEFRLAQATKEYTNIKRRGTEAEAQVAYQAREQAKAGRESARRELSEAENAQAAALDRNRAAIRAETEARTRVAEQARQAAREGLANQRLGLPAPGQTVQGMPVHLAQTRTVGYMPDWTPGQRPAGPDPRQDATARAQQAESFGQLARAASIYRDELGQVQRAEALEQSAMVQQMRLDNAKATARVAQANREAAVSFYPLSQAMHRHGALTSEFIAAAARGEVTLREMGNQAVITAGKFAGWTVAASAVYGVAGALGQVAEGAIAASSGADRAYRVINQGMDRDALTADFSRLSKQFNVPIETAADAVYRMGQVFHDQDEAVKAAEASLYSFKTGEVSVEESTRNLIAVQNAFGLSAGELVGIFDILNDAQNKFGANIGDMESGIAKAGGAWRQAGGDLEYLSALMVAITKATGRPGTEIGTAMARLYYVQHPESVAKLKQLGVDVDTRDVQKTLESAFEIAQQFPERIQELSVGLFGGQYARLLTPVLTDPRRFRQAQQDLGFDVSAGSGARELEKVLNQVDEQLQQVLNGLQRLGEGLNTAGAFNWLGLMLKALNGSIDAANQLLQIFNAIPAPIRQAVTMLGQAAAAVAIMRRLGGTERLANTPFGFMADPAGRHRIHTIAGLRQGQTEAYNRLEQYGRINVDKAFEADVRQQLLREHEARMKQVEHLDPEDETRKKVERDYSAATMNARRAENDLATSTKRLDAARTVAVRAEDDLAAAQRTSRRRFADVAAQRGWPSPRDLNQPNTAGIQGGGMMVLPGGGRAGDPGAQRVRQASRQMSGLQLRLMEWTAAARVLAQDSGRIGTAADRAVVATGRGVSAVAGSVGRIRGVGASMRNLAASLGPLDIAILALIAGQTVDSIVDHYTRELKDLEKYAGAAAGASTEAEIRELKRRADALKGNLGAANNAQYRSDTWEWINDIFNPVELFGSTLPEIITGDYERPQDRRARANYEIYLAAEEQKRRERLQNERRAAGRPIPQLTYEELKKSIDADAADRRNGIISQAEFDRRMGNHAIEAKTLLNGTKQMREAARRAIADAQRAAHGAGYEASLMQMPVGEFQKEMQGQAAAVDMYGLTPHNLDYLKKQYEAAEKRWRNRNDPDALIALNQARQAYMQAVIGAVNKELQFALLSASNEYERREAYNQANEAYKKARIGMEQQTEAYKKRQAEERRRLREQQDVEDRGGRKRQRYIGEEAAGPTAPQQQLTDDQIRKREDRQRRERIRLTKKQRRELDKELARQNRELDMATLQLKQAAYDDRAQGREILLNLQVARTQDPLAQARLQVDTARRQVEDARREWGTKSRQYRQALTQLLNAQQQQAQAILAGVQADNALLMARAGDDPVAQANAAVTAAERELAVLQRTRQDPNQIKQKQADIINARRQAREAQEQQTADIIRLQGELAAARAGNDPVLAARAAVRTAQLAKRNATTEVERLQALVDLARANNQLMDALAERAQAMTELAKSRTDDPVEQARLDMEAARKALAGSRGYDRIKKQTDYNNARKAWQQAQIDSRVDDINFNLAMDKITTEEAARQLEALANMKGISKQKKRELLLQAKQLRDEASGDYELDVGSIRLPTLYEVRRFVQAGQPNASQIVTDNRSFTVYLGSAEAVDAFASQLELTNGTSALATARSMQMR